MISEKNFFLRKLNNYGFETLKSNGNFLHVNFGKKRYKIAKKNLINSCILDLRKSINL